MGSWIVDHGSAAAAVRVGIGLVGRGGRYLVRLRPDRPGSPMPGVWEFPGGKCERNESPADAARRECGEELGIAVVVRSLRRVTAHRYPHGLIELHYYDCDTADPGAEPASGSGFRWVAAAELPRLTFPAANEPVLAELAAEFPGGGPPT